MKNIKFYSGYTFIIFIHLLFVSFSYAQTDFNKILKRVDEIRAPDNDFIFSVKANVNNGSNISEYLVRVNNSDKSIVSFTKPIKNKGRVILMDGRNMWVYIPNTSRAMRISPQQQLVGAASNADIARVVFSLDYNVEKLNKIKIGNDEYLELKLNAKETSAPYRKINLLIDNKTYRPYKSELFSVTGKLLKTIEYTDYKEILGESRPTKLIIKDNVNIENTTELTYTNYKLEKTPSQYFQPSYLNRLE